MRPPMDIIKGDTPFDPDTVRDKVSPCHGTAVEVHTDEEKSVNWSDTTLICSECRAEVREVDLVADNDALPLSQVDDLEEYEEGREFREESMEGVELRPLTLPTLADAQRAASRVAYLRGKAAELTSLYDDEEKAILAALETLRQRKADAVKPYERRIGWYLFALEQFHRERLAADPKEKTIKLPAGDLAMRAQQPEWVYGDTDTVTTVLSMYRDDLVRVNQEPDKVALKKAARVQDGKVYIEDQDGELHELPITVQERPPKFEFKTA